MAIYDVNQLFTKAYNDPEAFGLDEDKKHTPFIKSKDFEDTDNQKVAKGFMFWDEVHPTEAVHKQLANDMQQTVFAPTYNFSAPKDSLLNQFQESYGKRWVNDKAGNLGFFRKSNIDYKNADLTTILRHGLFEKGYRTLDVIVELGWVNRKKALVSSHPLIDEAMRAIEISQQKKFQKEEEHLERACRV